MGPKRRPPLNPKGSNKIGPPNKKGGREKSRERHIGYDLEPVKRDKSMEFNHTQKRATIMA